MVAYPQRPEEVAEKAIIFVLPSEARNLSDGWDDENKERFLASLGRTKLAGGLFPQPLKPARSCSQKSLGCSHAAKCPPLGNLS